MHHAVRRALCCCSRTSEPTSSHFAVLDPPESLSRGLSDATAAPDLGADAPTRLQGIQGRMQAGWLGFATQGTQAASGLRDRRHHPDVWQHLCNPDNPGSSGNNRESGPTTCLRDTCCRHPFGVCYGTDRPGAQILMANSHTSAGLTASTGLGHSRSTRCDTLPRSSLPTGLRCLRPMTSKSASGRLMASSSASAA